MDLKEFDKKETSSRVCDRHRCKMWKMPIVVKGKQVILEQCPECTKGMIEDYERELNKEAKISSKLAESYAIFDKYSLHPPELRGKTLENFQADSRSVDKSALNFAKRMINHYLKDGTGNCIVTGPPGVGKSHLTIGMAKFLNEAFNKMDNPKSVLFISVLRLFTDIEQSFGGQGGFTEADAVDLLSRVDFLFLDDLGKESRMSDGAKQANEWRQRVLFKILDNRQTTIINTNLTSQEIKRIYDPALADRIFKKVSQQSFKFPDDVESRRY